VKRFAKDPDGELPLVEYLTHQVTEWAKANAHRLWDRDRSLGGGSENGFAELKIRLDQPYACEDEENKAVVQLRVSLTEQFVTEIGDCTATVSELRDESLPAVLAKKADS